MAMRIVEKLMERAGALSYFLILMVLGLPLWWQTTTVYRANLPYPEIEDLSSIKMMKQKVHVLLITEDAISDHKLGPQIQALLLKSDVYDVELSVRAPRQAEKENIVAANSLSDMDSGLGSELSGGRPGWIVLLEVPARFLDNTQSVVASNQRVLYFSWQSKPSDIVSLVMDVMLGEYSLHYHWKQSRKRDRRHQLTGDLARKKTTGSLDLQLSLLVPEPDLVTVNWQIKSTVDTWIKPFLNTFPLNVSVNSQVLYLTDLKLKQGGSGGLSVTGEQIGLAINHVESLLNSQSSVNPAINLIIYIPKIEQSPLKIKDSGDKSSFVVPRWGGVIVYNFYDSSDLAFKFPTQLDLDMEAVAGIWLGQLRTLLGVSNVDENKALPLPHTGMRLWESDFQHRIRSQENILETRGTLQSLSSLLGQISNIVIIEDIARRVEKALESLRSSLHELEEGNILQGHLASQVAIQQSEAAFFDPSLLALLYFPDDQKYAIYVPYFVPVGLPILLSLKSIIKLLKKRDKED